MRGTTARTENTNRTTRSESRCRVMQPPPIVAMSLEGTGPTLDDFSGLLRKSGSLSVGLRIKK